MLNSAACAPAPTNADRRWPYQQYYLGEKDQERRSGQGQNYWSGAESLEWYTGKFVRDTMHGAGDYRWRYKGPDNAFVTYEGNFYGNRMHGYGLMSYPDGRVFNGIFYNNMRWGPGIESHACLQENVGLWRGNQLVRLTWRPQTPNVPLDFTFGPNAKACVEPNRTLLTTRNKIIGEVNSAMELLKQSGAEPLTASEKWTKLYPKNCTDLASQLCQVDVFDNEYYRSKIQNLGEVDTMTKLNDVQDGSHESFDEDSGTYYAWNNSKMVKNMMKHCFKHETQRRQIGIDLKTILTGPRTQYKSAGKHELDSRTILMASYLGHITNVARLINESNVHPDVADILGNTALMYATCGDQANIVHFLVEAGANVNSFNDSCYTPLGLSLMKYACRSKGITANGMVQSLIPPPVTPASPPIALEAKPLEWHITRDLPVHNPGVTITRSGSKTLNKTLTTKKPKSSATEVLTTKMPEAPNGDVEDTSTEEKRMFQTINTEFTIKVTDLFSLPTPNPVPYIFEVNDMVKVVDAIEEEQKKPSEKNPKKAVSKVIRDTVKPSTEIICQSSDRDVSSMSSADKEKMEMLNLNMATILQLLTDGANPCLVRCPQPALLIATVSGCPDLVRHLVQYGADVTEVYPQILHYTALDVAVSQPLTYENLEVTRALLECGAKADHRLKYGEKGVTDTTLNEEPGPTLLHTVLAKKVQNETEEEIRRQLLELLLEYGCCPLTQFKGKSPLDIAINNVDKFDIFIKYPGTDLNAPINDCNQTVLVKMFWMPFCKSVPVTERLQKLTNLLLFGADPLLECQNGEEKYKNIFVFANRIFTEMDNIQPKSSSPVGKLTTDDVGDYKQALDLVTECARILYVRWLQAKLLKELIQVVTKYEHRQWNMILPEHKNTKACGLWLSCPRTLEIWDILKGTKKKKPNDRRILKHILCIVKFSSNRAKTNFKWPLTSEEKGRIETDVGYILREHKIAVDIAMGHNMPWTKPYVMPELTVGAEEKFEVCFECAIPFNEDKISCSSCKLVAFCSIECIRANIDRYGCHPCSEYLKMKYFSSPDETVSHDIGT